MAKKRVKTVEEQLQLAMAEAQALFYAKNSFSLWRGSGGGHVSSDKMLAEFKMLPKSSLAKLARLVDAHQSVAAMLNEVGLASRKKVDEASEAVLKAYATPVPHKPGWYEFASSDGWTKKALVRGFDSFYMPRNGKHYCGSIRVSPDGTGSSEPWLFCITKGRIEIQPDCLY